MRGIKVFFLIFDIWKFISIQRRKQFYLLIVLIILSSLAELISIGAVIPFLSVIIDTEQIHQFPIIAKYIQIFGHKDNSEMLLFISMVFIIATIFAGAIRLLYIWVSTNFSQSTGADLSAEIYRRTLYQPYIIHISRNSSEVISGITIKANSLSAAVFSPMLEIIGSILIIGSIFSLLLTFEPIISMISFGGFALIYVLISVYFKRRLIRISKIVSNESNHIIKSLQEGLAGIRDVLISGTQEVYCNEYEQADRKIRKAYAEGAFTNQSPKIIIESLGIIFIVCFSYILTTVFEPKYNIIALLGALAFSAQKILPLMQQSYQAWARIISAEWVLDDVIKLLNQPLPLESYQTDKRKILFKNAITLTNVYFKYKENGAFVLNDINLKIKKGEKLGIIGKSGSGKSTLLDLIMGLLQPNQGVIKVDDMDINILNLRYFQNILAHVPQAIFLSDTTITENIALGIPLDQIDLEKVRSAAKQAQLYDFIESLPEGFKTITGERGVRLSGGQRQRIGIARALYKDASIIVFDEATSALDDETEQSIIESINNLSDSLTIIIIAHRLSTLKYCNRIIDIEKGELKRTLRYSDIDKTV
jgi:ATP-binding cassette, subfamily B, bacterial PglK